ncbi:MAG: LysM peptidoglycan-binding domain-containing protein [Planctomycetota bacterium]|jgi:nucleoid-associated protein YgaU
MQKDLKIGLTVGLVVVSIATIWLATRPGLSPQARMLDTHGGVVGRETADRSGARERNDLSPSTAERPVGRARTNAASGRASRTGPVRYTPPDRSHVVRDGETLSQISFDYYGSAGKWQRIFEANRKVIKDANVVKPGTKLIIPN